MKSFTFLILALMLNNAWASDEDADSCVYYGQQVYDAHICDIARKEKANDDAIKQRQADRSSGANLETCYWNTGTVIESNYCETMRKEQSEKVARKKEEDEHNAQLKREYDAEQASLNKNREAFHREQEREEADQKRKCGKDYQRLRIGMKISRLQECSGATYFTKTVSADGVVETYRAMFDWVFVKNGVVTGYTERK